MKIIGIAGRAFYNKEDKPIFQFFETMRRACAGQPDIAQIGLLPDEDINYLEIESGTDSFDPEKLDFILDKCDGFIIPGGVACFQFDEYIIRHAVRHDKPLLAVCLGFQLLCHCFENGRPILQPHYEPIPKTNHTQREPYFMTMTQIPNDTHRDEDATKYVHNVNITERSQLHQIVGSNKIPVNSLHHYQVAKVTLPLVVNAVADDGVIEGVELPGKKFIVGTQWHPEALNDDASRKIFDAFVDAVRKNK